MAKYPKNIRNILKAGYKTVLFVDRVLQLPDWLRLHANIHQ